jgi:hypothetical protein
VIVLPSGIRCNQVSHGHGSNTGDVVEAEHNRAPHCRVIIAALPPCGTARMWAPH